MVKNPIAALVVAALSLAGCSKAVEITSPTASPLTAPLTAFSVKFSPFFVPGTFSAQLDGADKTAGFVPAAAPSGTSTWKSPAPEGLTGGTQFAGGPVRSNPPAVIPAPGPGSGNRGTPSAAPGSVPPTAPASVSGGCGSNVSLFQHQLHVSGQCNGLICATTDDFVFVPIHLVANPTTLNLKVQQKVPATLEACPASMIPITVTVRPVIPSVSLNGQPAGTLIKVTIPPGGFSSTPFTITGLQSSILSLMVEAAGVQVTSIQGTVNP